MSRQLVRIEPDAGLLVSGYEHHTWHCSGCGEDERRMVFTRLSHRSHLLRRTRAGIPSDGLLEFDIPNIRGNRVIDKKF